MPRPHELRSYRRGAEWAIAAGAALELGIFAALSEQPTPADGLAKRLSLHPRGVRILLGALEALDLVRSESGVFALTGQGRARFVDAGTPDYEAAATRQWMRHIQDWATLLPETVRSGGPPAERIEKRWDQASLSRFMSAMAAKPPDTVRAVADLCMGRLAETGRAESGWRALDLGGGPGAFAREFVRRGMEVTLADRPEVIDHVATAYGLDGVPGLRLWKGDFLSELPEGPFHLVFLANVSHIYDVATNRTLISRLSARLAPGGPLAVLDFTRDASEFAALFAITMLLNTEGGTTYTRREYEAWMAAAGLAGFRHARVDADRELLSARKPAE
ncbi:MAG: methyltransferase [Gemmatimonadota bacterium]